MQIDHVEVHSIEASSCLFMMFVSTVHFFFSSFIFHFAMLHQFPSLSFPLSVLFSTASLSIPPCLSRRSWPGGSKPLHIFNSESRICKTGVLLPHLILYSLALVVTPLSLIFYSLISPLVALSDFRCRLSLALVVTPFSLTLSPFLFFFLGMMLFNGLATFPLPFSW